MVLDVESHTSPLGLGGQASCLEGGTHWKQDFPHKLAVSLPIFADVPCSKCPWLGQCREVSTQRVRAEPK